MTLQYRTILNARNPRRFVHDWAATSYLFDRQRKNLQYAVRRAEAARDAAIRSPAYGTQARLARAHAIRDAADQHVELEERLAAFPPPGEARHKPASFTTTTATTEPGAFRLAAD